jgi:hypothetical protein
MKSDSQISAGNRAVANPTINFTLLEIVCYFTGLFLEISVWPAQQTRDKEEPLSV